MVDMPKLGDRALHKNGRLDSREVVELYPRTNEIGILIGTGVVVVPAGNYTYTTPDRTGGSDAEA